MSAVNLFAPQKRRYLRISKGGVCRAALGICEGIVFIAGGTAAERDPRFDLCSLLSQSDVEISLTSIGRVIFIRAVYTVSLYTHDTRFAWIKTSSVRNHLELHGDQASNLCDHFALPLSRLFSILDRGIFVLDDPMRHSGETRSNLQRWTKPNRFHARARVCV